MHCMFIYNTPKSTAQLFAVTRHKSGGCQHFKQTGPKVGDVLASCLVCMMVWGFVPQGPELDEERAAAEMQFGGPRGAAGQWASCVRVIDPATASTAAVLELDENEVRSVLCVTAEWFPEAYSCALAQLQAQQIVDIHQRQSRHSSSWLTVDRHRGRGQHA